MKPIKLAALTLSAVLFFSACTYIPEPDGVPVPDESDAPTVTEPPETQPTGTEQTDGAITTTSEPIVRPPAPPTINEISDYADFDERIAEIASSLDVVGLGLCVFADGEPIYAVNYGYADLEAGIPADCDTVYRSASISKLISTVVLMTLYDQGKIDIDSDLEELTGIPYNDPEAEKTVRLRHLLTHTSGLYDSEAYGDSYLQLSDLEFVIGRSHSEHEPGTHYSYSNLGMGTLGAIVERLTGEFFHYYADRVLFKPLGMDAAYCVDLIGSRENAANLYQDGELVGMPKNWGRTTAYYELYGLGNSYHSSQGELLITTADLARLGVILAGDGSLNGVRIISEEAVKLINTTAFSDDKQPFDMGLAVRKYNGNFVPDRTIYGHPGQAWGSVNGLYYDPEDGTGVAICSVGCSIEVNEDNGVYLLLDKCVNEVYGTFFS